MGHYDEYEEARRQEQQIAVEQAYKEMAAEASQEEEFIKSAVSKINTARDREASARVNHPHHYTCYKNLEIIQLTEQMNFCRGNAVKYIARAGIKDKDKEIEDLRKAVWYIEREIKRLESE